MDDTQIYIGTPNGIVLCADSCSGHIFKGRFYHLYSKEPVVFNNQDQLIFGMEKFYDSILFPHPANNVRSFAETGKNNRNKNSGGDSRESRQLRMNNLMKKTRLIRITALVLVAMLVFSIKTISVSAEEAGQAIAGCGAT